MVKSIGSIGSVFVMLPVIGACKKSSFGRTFLFPLIETRFYDSSSQICDWIAHKATGNNHNH